MTENVSRVTLPLGTNEIIYTSVIFVYILYLYNRGSPTFNPTVEAILNSDLTKSVAVMFVFYNFTKNVNISLILTILFWVISYILTDPNSFLNDNGVRGYEKRHMGNDDAA